MNRLLLTSSLGSLLALAGCSRHDTAQPPSDLPTMSVETAIVTRATSARFDEITGTVRPKQQATIASRITGTIAAIHATLGQQVQAGELLIELSAGEIDARLTQAEAALAQAARDHERESNLLERGASTSDLVKSLLDRKRQAEGAVAEARAMMAYARIVAPFDGVISGKVVDAGDLASSGDPLLYLETGDSLRVECGVPQSLAGVKAGSSLETVWDSRSAMGTVAEVSPSADPRSRTFLVKIDLPQGTGLRSGQFVRVRVPAGESGYVEVPGDAVTVFGQMERVFVVKQGRAILRIVRTAGSGPDGRVKVLSGLEEGDIVVTPVPAGLRDGQPVEVRS